MGDKGNHKKMHKYDEGGLRTLEEALYQKLCENRDHEKTFKDYHSDIVAKLNELEKAPNRDATTNEMIKALRLGLECIAKDEEVCALEQTLYLKLCVNRQYETEIADIRNEMVTVLRELEQEQNRDVKTNENILTLRKALDCIAEAQVSCPSTVSLDK